MRVLVSTTETQGQRDNDFCWVPEGELVVFGGLECGGEEVDGPCGCKRDMSGIDCRKGTTTFRVEDRPDLHVEDLALLVVESDIAAGWGEDQERGMAVAESVGAIAADYPVGTVLERREGIQAREITEGAGGAE